MSNPRTDSEMAQLLLRLNPRVGFTPLTLPGVGIYRQDGPVVRHPVIYDPALVVVAQGRKRAILDQQSFVYDAEHYLVLSVPLPVESEVLIASPERPFVSLKVGLDTGVIRALLLDMAPAQWEPELQRGLSISPLTGDLRRPTLRLLRALQDPTETRILGPAAVREILYRTLTGPQGNFLIGMALGRGHHHQVGQALQRIHREYRSPLDVPSLARTAGMSASRFHEAFKAITSLTPIQYLKRIRLHRACSLMVYEGSNASEAAFAVGYNSSSQFSREFKRFFQIPPTQFVSQMLDRAG